MQVGHILIVPAILEQDLEDITTKVEDVDGFAHLIHIDISDGNFVSSKTFQNVSSLEKINTESSIELHLMVSNPQKYIPSSNERITKLIVHVESIGFDRLLLEDLREKGFHIGIALNPETSIIDLEPFLDYADCVQFMTIHPGLQGQKFLPEVIEKIKDFKKEYPDIEIEVDGGINPKNAQAVAKAGASFIVSGSYLMECEDLAKCFMNLEEAVDEN